MKCQVCLEEIELTPGKTGRYKHVDTEAQIRGRWPIHRPLPYVTAEAIRNGEGVVDERHF